MTVNGKAISSDLPGDSPLLWPLRDALKLTGTKFGCGIPQCGACTVPINGNPMRSCVHQSLLSVMLKLLLLKG
jgi:isoquinoline 1-oxidoreductase alpha subunit